MLWQSLGFPALANRDYVDQELLKMTWRIQGIERTVDRTWLDTLVNRRIALRKDEFDLDDKIKASDNEEAVRAYRAKLVEIRDDLAKVNAQIEFLEDQINKSMRRF